MSGFDKTEIIDKLKWSDFVVKADLERLQEYHAQRLKDGDPAPTHYECGITKKNGEIVYVIVDLSLMGAMRIVSLTDISQRKTSRRKNQVLIFCCGAIR